MEAWAKRRYNMYNLVKSNQVKPYREYCTKVLTSLRDSLNEKYDIKTEFYLVGSGANNLVTQDGNGPFDLDYNLRILSMSKKYWNDLKLLKNTVRNTLNEIVGDTFFSDGQDSRSVITSNLFLKNDRTKKNFSFDIAIIAKMDNGNLCRLIHNKQYGQFTWNEIPSTIDLNIKVKKLKQYGYWGEVRDTYLAKKNMYLQRRDYNHSSFVVYVETVNDVYNKYRLH